METTSVKQVDVPKAEFESVLAQRQALSSASPSALHTTGTTHTNGAEAVGQVSEAITDDSQCDSPDLWLDDTEGCPPYPWGTLLCFTGAGSIDLSTIPYPWGGTWASKVAAVSPGVENGVLWSADFTIANEWPPEAAYGCYGAGGDGWPRYVTLTN